MAEKSFWHREVGDEIRYHSCNLGWSFGRVIRTWMHEGDFQMSEVRWTDGDRNRGRTDTCEIPSFRLELCS